MVILLLFFLRSEAHSHEPRFLQEVSFYPPPPGWSVIEPSEAEASFCPRISPPPYGVPPSDVKPFLSGWMSMAGNLPFPSFCMFVFFFSFPRFLTGFHFAFPPFFPFRRMGIESVSARDMRLFFSMIGRRAFPQCRLQPFPFTGTPRWGSCEFYPGIFG